MLGKVVSSELQIANQSVPKAWGGGERLDVEETTWTKEAGGAAKAKSMLDRGSEDAQEAYIENADTITVWGCVDCDVALDAAMIVI